MVDKILTELIGSSPIAVALLMAMWLFVRFLQGERDVRGQQLKDCHLAHADALRQCETMMRETNEVIRECAKTHGQVAEALRSFNPQIAGPISRGVQ